MGPDKSRLRASYVCPLPSLPGCPREPGSDRLSEIFRKLSSMQIQEPVFPELSKPCKTSSDLEGYAQKSKMPQYFFRVSRASLLLLCLSTSDRWWCLKIHNSLWWALGWLYGIKISNCKKPSLVFSLFCLYLDRNQWPRNPSVSEQSCIWRNRGRPCWFIALSIPITRSVVLQKTHLKIYSPHVETSWGKRKSLRYGPRFKFTWSMCAHGKIVSDLSFFYTVSHLRQPL